MRRGVLIFLALLVLAPAGVADAAFPGANGRIAYVHTRDNPDGTITQSVRTVRPDGRGVRVLFMRTAETPARPFYGPRWNPSGSRLVLEHLDDMAIATPRGRVLRRLGLGGQPNWSPDGRRIVFSSPLNETDTALFTVRTDGGGRRQLGSVFEDGGAESPALSPRGGRLAFEVYRNGNPTLWLARADGSDARPVLEGAARPAFSPDGRTLAFSYEGRVWLMPMAGGLPRAVTPAVEQYTVVHGLAFSPDGRRLVYARQLQAPTQLGPSNLFVIRRGGGRERRLRVGDLVGSPDWQPLPRRARR